MTSTPTRRTNTVLRHVAREMNATVAILEAASDVEQTHPDARYAYRAVALELRRLSRIVLGDIGEEQEEVEVVPLHNPAEVPAEPVPA